LPSYQPVEPLVIETSDRCSQRQDDDDATNARSSSRQRRTRTRNLRAGKSRPATASSWIARAEPQRLYKLAAAGGWWSAGDNT